MMKIEPFGYFKAELFGWTDCSETDEGAQPLYDKNAIDTLAIQRDMLLSALIAFREGGPEGGQDFAKWHESYLPAIEKAREAIRSASA